MVPPALVPAASCVALPPDALLEHESADSAQSAAALATRSQGSLMTLMLHTAARPVSREMPHFGQPVP